VSLDLDARAYLDRAAASGVPPNHELPVAEARRLTEEAAPGLFGPTDPVGSVADLTFPGPGGPLPVRVYEPSGERPFPVLVYLHGGGWVVGSVDTHDGVCRALAARTPCLVLSVGYRLAPEHRFPAALDDAWAVTAWAGEHAASFGGDAARVAVGGDSAGGNLAAVVALRARDRGLSLAAQLLVYPVVSRACDTPSYTECSEGYGLSAAAMEWYWEQYLGPDGDGDSDEASPLWSPSLAGVAPALVVTAEYDPLRDEGEAYAARLAAEGVPVRLSRYDGLVHGFVRMPAVIRRANAALDEAASALRAAFGSYGGFPGRSCP
jgi:acetyl esterase